MKNRVELIDYMGSDKSHCLAAWASTFYDLDIDMPQNIKMRVDEIFDYIMQKSKKMRSMEDLLKYLADEKHESPFRMSGFVFGMTTDVATHIQKLKHAVILEAENAESAKYKELKEDKFYLPLDWLDYGEKGAMWFDILKAKTTHANNLYHNCLEDLTNAGMSRKRAKETARYFKTYNSQLNSQNKLSFAGVMTFHDKRTVDFAQNEIADIARLMVEAIQNIPGEPFKYSLKAFGF